MSSNDYALIGAVIFWELQSWRDGLACGGEGQRLLDLAISLRRSSPLSDRLAICLNPGRRREGGVGRCILITKLSPRVSNRLMIDRYQLLLFALKSSTHQSKGNESKAKKNFKTKKTECKYDCLILHLFWFERRANDSIGECFKQSLISTLSFCEWFNSSRIPCFFLIETDECSLWRQMHLINICFVVSRKKAKRRKEKQNVWENNTVVATNE